jgi:hypothetical protein
LNAFWKGFRKAKTFPERIQKISFAERSEAKEIPTKNKGCYSASLPASGGKEIIFRFEIFIHCGAAAK